MMVRFVELGLKVKGKKRGDRCGARGQVERRA
jgi:hypothetical protein